MKITTIIGLSLLACIWLWLAFVMLSTGGVTLKNLLLLAMSGIIVFVPLFRKYAPVNKRKRK